MEHNKEDIELQKQFMKFMVRIVRIDLTFKYR